MSVTITKNVKIVELASPSSPVNLLPYVPRLETGNLATTGYVGGASGYLKSLIQASSAGVSTLNLQSGNLSLTGAGGISITFNAQTFTISGQSGQFVTTGQTGVFALNDQLSSFLQKGGVSSNTSLYLTDALLGLSTFSYDPSGKTFFLKNPSDNQIIDVYNDSPFISGFDILATGRLLISGKSVATGLVIRPSDTGNFADKAYVNNISGILDNKVNSTGSYLYGLIQSSSAGVSALNSKSGTLTVTGAGNVSISINGQTFTFSGDTGSLVSTGYAANNFYPLNSNPSGYVKSSQTGNFVTTGVTGQFIGRNEAGDFNLYDAPNSFNGLEWRADEYLSLNWYNKATINVYDFPNHVYPYISGFNILNASGIFATGAIKLNNINVSLSGHGHNYVTGFSITGGNGITGLLLLQQTGDVSIIQSGNTIIFSGFSGYIKTSDTGSFAAKTYVDNNLTLITNWTGITTGIFYPLNTNPSGYIKASETGQFVGTNQTGSFVTTGQTGLFATTGYVNNESGVIDSRLVSTGSYLYSLIQASSAGVSSINVQSGSLSFTGAGNVRVIVTGQTFTFSGDTGAYSTIVFKSETGNFITTGITGQFVGDGDTGSFVTTGYGSANYYPLNSNPSGYVQNTQTGSFITSGITGQFVGDNETGVFTTKTYVDATFSTVKVTGSSAILAPNFSGIGGTLVILSGSNVLVSGAGGTVSGGSGESNTASNLGSGVGIFSGKSSIDLRFYSLTGIGGTIVQLSGSEIQISGAGSTGNFVSRSETGSFATTGYVNTVSGVLDTRLVSTGSYITGQLFPLTGLVILSGAGGISITTGSGVSGQIITISGIGVTSLNSLSGNVGLTGRGNVIVSTSGQYLQISGSGGASTVQVTGVNVSSPNFTGAGNVIVYLTGSNVVVSGFGSGGTGEANTASNLGNGVGIFSSKVGIDLRFYSLSGIGGTSVQLVGNEIQISGGGGNSSGGPGNVTGLNVNGGQSITGLINFQAAGGLSVIQNGNTIIYSGSGIGITSGSVFQNTLYIESPRTGEDISWFYNKDRITIQKLVTVCRGTSSSVGWSLYQTLDRSQNGSLIVSGLTTSLISGDIITGFNNNTISGDVFVLFKTQVTGGISISDFSLTLIGEPKFYDISGNLNTRLEATGQYVESNFSKVKVTGSSVVSSPNFSGIGGTLVILSGSSVLISGAGSGGAGGAGTGESNTASNLGSGVGVFSGKVGVDLRFYSLTGIGGTSVRISGSEIQISGATSGDYITRSETGQFVGDNETGAFATTGYVTNNFYPLASNPSGYVSISHNHNYVTGINVNGAGALTGTINFQAAGSLTVIQNGNTIIYSGTGAAGGTLSGQVFQHSLYIENPTASDNICWFYNKDRVTLDKIVSVCRGTSSTVGWTLYQTPDRSQNGSQIVSGFTTSLTTGNIVTSFDTNFISGDVFVLLKTQSTGGTTLNDFALTVIGQPTFYDISGALSNRLISTGSYLYGLIQSSSAGVSTINGLSGNLTLTGSGNITVINSGQNVIVSGNTGAYSTFVFKSETGQFVGKNATGDFAGLSYVNSTFSKVKITGSSTILSPDFTGLGSISVQLNGSTVYISGAGGGGSGEANTASNLGSGVGIFSSKVGIDLRFYSLTGIGGTVVQLSGTEIQISGGGATGNFVTRAESGQFVGDNETGSFITTGQTGLFATTGYTSSNFYPLNSNPSGYVRNTETGSFVSTGITGQFVGDSETGNFATTGYTETTFSKIKITGSQTVLSPNLTGAGNVSISLSGSQVTISGTAGVPAAHDHNYVTGIITNGTGPALTGTLDFRAAGNLTITQNGNILTYSGAGSVATASGQVFQNSIYIESPTATDNFCWFYNKDRVFLERIVSVCRGNSSTVGWTLTQTTDRSVAGSQIVSGSTNSLTTGNLINSFDNNIISGNVFVLLKTQSTGGTTINDFSLTLVGQPTNYDISGVLQTQITNLQNQTGSYITTGQTGQFIGRNGTGDFAGLSYVNSTFSTVKVTGSAVVLVPSFSGIGGTLVILSGSNILVSGAGNTGAGGGEVNTASNLGSGVGISSGKVGVDLRFYSLTGIGGTTVQLVGSEIQISGGGSTGNFVLKSETGSFITTAITGQFVGDSDTGIFITTGMTGQFVGDGDTGVFTTKTYVDATFSSIKVTGSSVILSPNLIGTGYSTVLSSGSQVIISGNVHDHNYLTGLSVTGGPAITGLLTINSVGGINVIQNGNSITISGANSSGQAYSNSIYIESPRSGEDFCWFFNKDPIFITKAVSVCRGTSSSIGWTLYQTPDRTQQSGLIVTGLTNSLTTGNTILSGSFNKNTISGGMFVLLKTQITGGTINDFSLTILGEPLLQVLSGQIFQQQIDTLNSQTGSYATTTFTSSEYVSKTSLTANNKLYLVNAVQSSTDFVYDPSTGLFYIKSKSGQTIDLYNSTPYVSGFNIYATGAIKISGKDVLTGALNQGQGSGLFNGVSGNILTFKSLLPGSGIIISGDSNNNFVIYTPIGFSTGIFSTSTTTMTSGSAFYTAVSGNISSGTWLATAQAYVVTSPNTGIGCRITTKLWDGSSIIHEATEDSMGFMASGISGQVTAHMTKFLSVTGVSTPIVLSCCASITGCQIRNMPQDFNTGMYSGCATNIELIRLA